MIDKTFFMCCRGGSWTSASLSLALTSCSLTSIDCCWVHKSSKRAQEKNSECLHPTLLLPQGVCLGELPVLRSFCLSNTWSTASSPSIFPKHIRRLKTLDLLQSPVAAAGCTWRRLRCLKVGPTLVLAHSSTSWFCASACWVLQGFCLMKEFLLQSPCWTWPQTCTKTKRTVKRCFICPTDDPQIQLNRF